MHFLPIVYTVLCRFRVAYSWPMSAKNDVIHKPEVHNASQHRQRRTEPRPEEHHKIGKLHESCTLSVVPEICSRTDEPTNAETYIHAHHYTPLHTAVVQDNYSCSDVHQGQGARIL